MKTNILEILGTLVFAAFLAASAAYKKSTAVSKNLKEKANQAHVSH